MSPEEAARHLRELDQGGISATGPLPPAELHAYLHKVRTYLEVLPDRASLAASVLRAETEPDNPVELHNAGVALAGAARGIAIPVLYSALARGLDDPMTVQVLAHALGTRGRPHEAVSLYRQHPWALAEEQARASCAHFAAMAGDLATTREMAAQLSSTATADARQLALSRVARAEALHRRSRPPWGLREWVGVLHGSVLLHESPHGVEVMHGRYAALWDDDNRLAQVLGLLNQVLIRAGRQPARVVGGRDRDSQILAAIAEGLVRPVPGHGPSAATTLAVYYTWNPDDDDVLHRSEDPGTVLFAYSLDWTRGHELVPDVIGMEAQHVTPAWGERIRLGTDESGARASQTIPADDRSPEELGPELGVLLQAVSPDLDPSLSAVLSVVDALRDAGPACSGLLRGTRRPYHPGGPASSTQFG